MLEIIKVVHENGYLHRDIKPDNFMFGHGYKDTNKVFIIDFGLVKEYKKDGNHIPFLKNQNSCGTWRYESINSL